MTRLVVAAIRAHRALLVLSTVGLGVAGSRVADQLGSVHWWLLLGACALLLWMSDMFRGFDVKASDLARSGRVPYRQAASDLIAKERTWIAVLFVLAVGLVIAALVLAFAGA